MFYRPHNRITAPVGDISLTKQSHKQECDINNILNQYKKTGIINHISKLTPTYSDLPDPISYQEALDTMREADNAFAELPSKVRDQFNNDPAQFLAAFTNEEKAEYLRELGLLKPVKGPSGPVQPGEPGYQPTEG